MRVKRSGIVGLVWLGLCVTAPVSHAQSADAPDRAASARPAPPPPGVTVPPQTSEKTPLRRFPPAFPAPDYEEPVQPPAGHIDPPRPSRFAGRPWYGNEILISDGLTGSLTGIGLVLATSDQSSNGELLLLGFGSYSLAAPLIHGMHGRWGVAVASLSMHFLIPVMGAFVGGAAAGCRAFGDDGISCGGSPAIGAGFLSGMVLASALDVGLFSYENRKPETGAPSTFGIAPALSADGKHAELRAFGTF